MDHVAIMKKSWGLLPKILSGEKTVESRWYKNRSAPWDKIKPGDALWFKDSGAPVTVKVRVTKVLQFDNLTPQKTKQILKKYGQADLGVNLKNLPPSVKQYFQGKRYCLLIFFDRVKEVTPFEINKAGFGAMSAWLCVERIEEIKK